MKKKSEYRKTVGRITRAEGGKSQARAGDVMQLAALFFDECVRNPVFLVGGLTLALRRAKRRK